MYSRKCDKFFNIWNVRRSFVRPVSRGAKSDDDMACSPISIEGDLAVGSVENVEKNKKNEMTERER